jgi:glycosyltransferase involved in cell wall biosynthesis
MKQRTKVAITTNSLNIGGAENQRVMLANELANLGCDVSILCLQSKGVLADDVSPDVRVVESNWFRGLKTNFDLVVTGTTNTEIGCAIIARFQRRNRRWLVVVHNPIGDGAPKLAWPSRIGMRCADGIASLTELHAKKLKEQWGLSTRFQLGNALSETSIDLLRNASETRLESIYDLGYIGRLSATHKGLDRLFEAMAEPEASTLTLAIAGTGADEQVLRQLADELGIADRITWLGFMRPNEFFGFINVFVLMSRFEGQPLVLLEAEVARVKVVASDTAGARDSDLTEVIEYESPRQLAGALVRARNARACEPCIYSPPVRSAKDMAVAYLEAYEIMKLKTRRTTGFCNHVAKGPRSNLQDSGTTK